MSSKVVQGGEQTSVEESHSAKTSCSVLNVAVSVFAETTPSFVASRVLSTARTQNGAGYKANLIQVGAYPQLQRAATMTADAINQLAIIPRDTIQSYGDLWHEDTSGSAK
jgi:hypothetical protein